MRRKLRARSLVRPDTRGKTFRLVRHFSPEHNLRRLRAFCKRHAGKDRRIQALARRTRLRQRRRLAPAEL
jgi:hypothetical protein